MVVLWWKGRGFLDLRLQFYNFLIPSYANVVMRSYLSIKIEHLPDYSLGDSPRIKEEKIKEETLM